MIELPEAQVLAGQMREMLTGKTITQVQVLQSPHGFTFFHGDSQSYGMILQGLTISGAAAFGGRPGLQFGDELRLSFGDGANLRYLAPGKKPPARHQLLLEFDDESALVCTVQMLGFIALFVSEHDSKNDEYYRAGVEKLSPHSNAFDLNYFNV